LINYQVLCKKQVKGNGGADRRIRDADANENFGIENVLESSMNRIQSLLNTSWLMVARKQRKVWVYDDIKEHSNIQNACFEND
jgi:hypothetical protein